MAAWQFDIRLIPRAVVAASPRASAAELQRQAWSTAMLPLDYKSQLAAIAPQARSWSPAVEMWGVEDGNRVDVTWIEGRLSSVLVRLDARDPSPSFAMAVLDLARRWDCLLLAKNGAVLKPDMEEMGPALVRSGAARFVSDPGGYLAELAAKKPKA